MTVLAVDLAAKFSACVLMDDDYQVLAQYDSWDKPEDLFLDCLADHWHTTPHPAVMVVEDLPHGLAYSTLVKTVCRIQGRLFEKMESAGGFGPQILWTAPAAWRAHYPGITRGTGAKIAVPVAASLGYIPPAESLLERAKKNGGKTRADKVATDYCAAYLIGRWAIDMHRQHTTYDVPGTSRYDTAVIRKKDLHDENR